MKNKNITVLLSWRLLIRYIWFLRSIILGLSWLTRSSFLQCDVRVFLVGKLYDGHSKWSSFLNPPSSAKLNGWLLLSFWLIACLFLVFFLLERGFTQRFEFVVLWPVEQIPRLIQWLSLLMLELTLRLSWLMFFQAVPGPDLVAVGSWVD